MKTLGVLFARSLSAVSMAAVRLASNPTIWQGAKA